MGQSFNTHHAVVLIARWPAGTSFTSATEQLLLRRTLVAHAFGRNYFDIKTLTRYFSVDILNFNRGLSYQSQI